MNKNNMKTIAWDKMDGLIPAVIQNWITGDVLMLGYMSPESLNLTIETKRATFYSRSRHAIWVKGETSGNYLQIKSISLDCDADSLLMQAIPAGPTCHTGSDSCFSDQSRSLIFSLEDLVVKKIQSDDASSYTKALCDQGLPKVAQKVGEEAVEVVIAALAEGREALLNESADLIYHLLLLLSVRGVSLGDVLGVLDSRRGD